MQRRRSPSRIGPGLTLTEPSQGRAPTTGFRDPGIELAPSSPRQDAGWAAGWLHKTWPAGRLPTPTSPLGGAQLRPPVGDGEEHAVRVAWAPVGEGSVLATSGVPHEVSGSEHSAVVIGVAPREHEDILWAQVQVAGITAARAHADQDRTSGPLGLGGEVQPLDARVAGLSPGELVQGPQDGKARKMHARG